MNYSNIIKIELKVDCYGGENCDEHRKYWQCYCEGDKDAEDTESDITFNLSNFPPGTKINVEEPNCPKCFDICSCCDCGFDWKKWAEEKYS
jgi:hypothetical protein